MGIVEMGRAWLDQRARARRLRGVRALGVVAMLAGLAMTVTSVSLFLRSPDQVLSVSAARARQGEASIEGVLRAQPTVVEPGGAEPLVLGQVEVTFVEGSTRRELHRWSGTASTAMLEGGGSAIPIDVGALAPIRDGRARGELEREPGRSGRVLAVRYAGMRFALEPPAAHGTASVERRTVPAGVPVVLSGVMRDGYLSASANGTISVSRGTAEEIAESRGRLAAMMACLGPVALVLGLAAVVVSRLRS